MSFSVVILAAGLGKRMKSQTPKVLHEVLGRPMLQYVLDAVRPLNPSQIVLVVGNGAEMVLDRVKDEKLSSVVQRKLLGTGNALAVARPRLRKGTTLVLNGDCPLITTGTLRGLLARHKKNRNSLSFLVFRDDAQSGYGRIRRDNSGKVIGIVEDKHATEEDRKICKELNGGVYALERDMLDYLEKIRKNRNSGEYYLTDLIGLGARNGRRVEAHSCAGEEIRGVNSRRELHEISDILKMRIVSRLMDRGVTFVNPHMVFVHPTVSVGKDTIVYPNTYLEGKTSIGKNCIIYPGARIIDSTIGDNVAVKDSTVIEESRVGSGSAVGPFAHLRPGSVIGRDAKIGNFVEIKKSRMGRGTKASHLSYLGDAEIGNNVNIGAGTITCNYDGKSKFRTLIHSGVFIGSDSQLVAPVTIGKDAYVAAGATITKDVPSGSLAISRTKQKNLRGWTKKKTGGKKTK